MKALPEALKDLLLERGMSQTDLWAAAGLSSGSLSKWANGKRGREFNEKSLETLRKISGVLGVPLTYWREYRLYQIDQAFQANAELDRHFYNEIMAYAAALEERESIGRSPKRSRESRAGRGHNPGGEP